jgi:ATPase family associated with various cellular activities (AAA)
MPDQAPEGQARDFAAAFRSFLDWIHTADTEDRSNQVAVLVAGFLGPDGAAHSVVSRDLPVFEHVNLQTAIDAWSALPGRTVEVRGLLLPPHHMLQLQEIVSGESVPNRLALIAPTLVDLPNGPETTLGCLKLALLLVTDARGRYILMVQSPNEHHHGLEVEVAGLPVAAAQAVLAELDQLRSALNVYRGHVLDVTINPMGGVVLTFAAAPGLRRDHVVLPEAVLHRVERHALGVAAHRDALLAAGQHLKRGLLLYGPPGTGKTHTTRYLIGQMTGYTRLVLTGRALIGVGAVTEMARDLQPSVVILEDVDLVAEDRSMGPRSSPVLFDLLDAMDGAAPDADLLFLLTTNRADLLEPALAARPGRVDVAVEIELPDGPARERLLALYGRGVPLTLTPQDIATAVERTEGTTASFLKELIRRSVLEALHDTQASTDDPPQPAGQGPAGTGPGEDSAADDGPGDRGSAGHGAAARGGPAVTGAHVARALDDLLDSAQGVTRTLLGVGVDPATLPAGGALAGQWVAGPTAMAHRRMMIGRAFRG